MKIEGKVEQIREASRSSRTPAPEIAAVTRRILFVPTKRFGILPS